MKTLAKVLTLVITFSLLFTSLVACQTTPTPTQEETLPPEETQVVEATTVPEPDLANDVLYVNLTWHQHQPLYYKNEDGFYTRPWVRAHATKDYLDMAQKVAEYPDVHVTFNITPSLIRQINDLASGAKDIYWALAEKPAAELTDAEKQFILERFFDANWTNVIPLFPRYLELLDLRGGTTTSAIQKAMEVYTEQDFMDLQVWFNLAWFDPAFLAEEPLASLVAKGEGFTQEDKAILFGEVETILQEVIPYHAALQQTGQIEVTTTPYAHPILPLIYDNQLALVGNPSAIMPDYSFTYPQDAEAHLAISVEMYEENFGQPVRGLWPGEGSVAQAIVPLVAEAGYTVMQTGEPVLAKSLGIGSFTRDSEGFVQEADLLYRPYYVTDDDGNQVAIFYRDGVLSDNIGFVYASMSGEEGAADLISKLEEIQARFVAEGSEGPHIVSIILDGENAWESYPNDGNDFFHALYQGFTDSEVLQTVTPSEYLEMFPEQETIDDLFPGAWFSANYDTWIGETEEAIAWDYLARVRADLAAYETGEKETTPEALAEAFDFMYLAEGSDWFWWYGTDQDSGQDSYFDEGFRALLAGVYTSLGEEVPRWVSAPIIQSSPARASSGFLSVSTPVIDGMDDEAWDTAGFYRITANDLFKGLYVTLDKDNLYLRITKEGSLAGKTIEFYLSVPGAEAASLAFAKGSDSLLGFNANKMLLWKNGGTLDLYEVIEDDWAQVETGIGQAAVGDESLEVEIPLTSLGDFSAGDSLRFSFFVQPDGDDFPVSGPAELVFPDLGEVTAVLSIEDPLGDDNGPGTYTYPEDAVFTESVYDAQSFTVGYTDENLVLTIGFPVSIENPWNSAIGLSLQTVDVYIDTDPGSGTGARLLLPGRNAALEEGFGWEYAVWAEGWTSQVIKADPDTLEPKEYSEATSGLKVFVDTARNVIVIRVPLTFLPEGDPATWGYAAAVLGQEGYPAEGVWRVRDVSVVAAQWLFGGAPADINHTRIIDLLLPTGSDPDQAAILSGYTGATGSLDALSANDYAQIPMLLP